MSSNTTAACAQALDIVAHPGYPDGSFSQSDASRSLLASTPSIEYDRNAERAGSRNGEGLGVNETPESFSLEIPATATATALTSRILNGTINLLCSQFNSLLNWSTVSDGLPVHGEGPAGSQPNEEPTTTTTTTQSWYSRPLGSFTFYGELSIARTPEEFASVRARLQQELTFDGGFLIGLAAVNTAVFAITADFEFKINSYAYRAIAISSAACGLGIACDVWFFLRYIWVDLETFTYRSRPCVSFSLSSRLPTLFMILSSITLMAFLSLIAFSASPISVLAIGILVVLVMTVQFIVYGTHQFAAFV